jgi:hypothetical protein
MHAALTCSDPAVRSSHPPARDDIKADSESQAVRDTQSGHLRSHSHHTWVRAAPPAPCSVACPVRSPALTVYNGLSARQVVCGGPRGCCAPSRAHRGQGVQPDPVVSKAGRAAQHSLQHIPSRTSRRRGTPLCKFTGAGLQVHWPRQSAECALAAVRSAPLAWPLLSTRRLPDTKAPAHLNGTLAGDAGFDPLGLGQDPDRLKWSVAAPA